MGHDVEADRRPEGDAGAVGENGRVGYQDVQHKTSSRRNVKGEGKDKVKGGGKAQGESKGTAKGNGKDKVPADVGTPFPKAPLPPSIHNRSSSSRNAPPWGATGPACTSGD